MRTTLGQSFRFVELANDVNDHMPEYVVKRLTVALNTRKLALNGSRTLLLGLAYKPNTSDMRESPAIGVAQRLLRLGADVRYVDDHVPELNVSSSDLAGHLVRARLSVEELEAADAVVVLTDHDDIDYDLVSKHARYVFDTRHRCRGETVEYL